MGSWITLLEDENKKMEKKQNKEKKVKQEQTKKGIKNIIDWAGKGVGKTKENIFTCWKGCIIKPP